MSVQRWMARSSRPLVAGRYRLIGCQNGVSLFKREATPMAEGFRTRRYGSGESEGETVTVRPQSSHAM